MPSATAKRRLTRERILRAGVALADSEGLDGLTMRKLGERLGVEAMSLYNHVANKDDLLGGMVEVVAAEIPSPPPDLDWKQAVREHAVATHDVFVRHPWVPALWASRMDVGPARMGVMERLLADLERGGLSPGLLDRAFHAIDNHVLGYTLQALSFPYPADDLPALSRDFLSTFPSDEFPHLAAHIRYHAEAEPGDERSFEFGLDLILDGIERLRDT